MIKHSEEFEREAVRIALISCLPRERAASDLGVGKSTLGKWLAQYRPTDPTPASLADLTREPERSLLGVQLPGSIGARIRVATRKSSGIRRACLCRRIRRTRSLPV